MAELSLDGSNPDVSLLRDINGLARDAPRWLDRVMEAVGEYGLILLMVLIAGWCWWRVARRSGAEAPTAVAGVIWSGLAAAVALVLNIPLRNFVDRPRPFLEHKGIHVLVEGKTDFSFVSDHATLTMAVAMGVFMVSRTWGLAAVAVALAEGFCRVYMGVHYPTDVLGGFALGTAVALLLAPAALALLTPLTKAVADSRLGVLVQAAPGRPEARRGEPYPEPTAVDKDLAA
ncbi:phosphatase PAP2 family protein [Actinacidiphila glaucinigra]|uniref:phosphatase PAP2 family protein n=1 Tax=Actinacidiphila glaucinigra TaxID=235986 RepID=UPI002DD7A533|nr:phosphatase PAP2 family protein [Actinacidiphila glaucinigra]WSD60932.1 phosphatase PAP2 family protein [Actinacidiphila glaucinigra]